MLLRPWMAASLLVLALPQAARAQEASTTLTAVATDPEGEAVLPLNRPLYVRLRYESTQRLRIRAAGFHQGSTVPMTTNASPVYGAGSGETLAWIASQQDAAVDEVRVTAVDDQERPLGQAAVVLSARWSATAAPRPPSAWARELNDAQQRALMDASREQMSRPTGMAWSVMFSLLLGAIPAYIALQAIALWRLQGRWRWAAAAPLVVMSVVFLVSLLALAARSNLWPVWLILTSPFALVYLGLLFLVRRLVLPER